MLSPSIDFLPKLYRIAFFDIKIKIRWLFTFFIPSTFAPNFNTLRFFLIIKFTFIFAFCIFFKTCLRVYVRLKFFQCFSDSPWLLLAVCDVFSELVIADLRISYLSNLFFIWLVCSDSDSCCCLIFSISLFICSTKYMLETRVIKLPQALVLALVEFVSFWYWKKNW